MVIGDRLKERAKRKNSRKATLKSEQDCSGATALRNFLGHVEQKLLVLRLHLRK
jgi:hypothetical protein